MKSKSPFGKNTPLKKIEIFQGSTSTYRHPSTVIQPIVGAEVGKKLAEVGSKIAVDAINAMPGKNQEPRPKDRIVNVIGETAKGMDLTPKGRDLKTTQKIENKLAQTQGTPKKTLKQAYAGRDMKEYGGMTFDQYKAVAKKDPLYGTSGTTGGLKRMESRVTYIDGKRAISTPYKETKNNLLAAQMKGSPVKHNAEASPKGFFAKTQARLAAAAGNAIKSQSPDRGGVSAEDFASGNYAKPADAVDATSVDTFTPPPNQVAETGSYSGGRDRILEMDSNPVVNQSIGRDTNIASQLFGSGQRASMLAMKGSPMHAHTPTHGKKYKKGDLIDESDFETLGTGYNVQNISDIQEDKKGQFITTLGDSEQKAPPIKSRPKSRIIDYPDPKGSVRDTIRPQVGKFFKRS